MSKRLKNKMHRQTSAVVLMIAATTLLAGLSAMVMAASDLVSINVTGKVIDNTCTVDTANSDLYPTLVDVSAHDLKGKGTTLGKRDIKLSLKDCGKDITRGVVITAKGTPDTADTEGYAFKNASTGEGAATGVGLQFYKTVDKTTPFRADGNDTETISTLKEGDNTLTFAAAYVATSDEPSAGDFSTTVNLTLAYK